MTTQTSDPPGESSLNELEAIIANGPVAGDVAGHALKEIRRRRLYRHGDSSFMTFGVYLQRRWNLSATAIKALMAKNRT